MSVQSPQQEGGNCHTGPVPSGQQPSRRDVRGALVSTVPGPRDQHILATAPARDVDRLGLSGPVAAGWCQLLQRFQSQGFLWPQRLCTFQDSQWNLVSLLVAGGLAWATAEKLRKSL